MKSVYRCGTCYFCVQHTRKVNSLFVTESDESSVCERNVALPIIVTPETSCKEWKERVMEVKE